MKITKKKIIIITAVLIAIIVLISVISIVESNPDRTLTDNEKTIINSVRQRKPFNNMVKMSEIKYDKVMLDDGNWKLSRIYVGPGNNPFFAISYNDQAVLDPATEYPIEDLINAGVSEKIIDYFYPNKPQLVGFNSSFDSYFPYTGEQVKFVINAYAQEKGITVNRITIVDGKIDNKVENAREDNRTETTTFKFQYNKEQAVYTFRSLYTATNMNTTFSILDSNGNILYSRQGE